MWEWLFSPRCRSSARLDGRTAVVTGCNTGIGKPTVRDLYRRGCRVVMACRDVAKAEAAAKEIRQETVGDQGVGDKGVGDIVVVRLDLSSFSSVRECAALLLDTEPHIHLLINNAATILCPKTLSEDGFELQFATNHLGHFLLTVLLLPRIRSSAPARIITVSSLSHAGGSIDFDDMNMDKPNAYGPMTAYSRSKFANVLFTRELAKQLKGTGVTTYAVHPGGVNTDWPKHLDEVFVRGTTAVVKLFLKLFFRTPEVGAQTTIYCAVDETIASESGEYYSDCKKSEACAQAKDEAMAARLWEESAKWVKLGDYDPFTAEDKNTVGLLRSS